jgi:hypothetical protein
MPLAQDHAFISNRICGATSSHGAVGDAQLPRDD